jgi:hypothetical protein
MPPHITTSIIAFLVSLISSVFPASFYASFLLFFLPTSYCALYERMKMLAERSERFPI